MNNWLKNMNNWLKCQAVNQPHLTNLAMRLQSSRPKENVPAAPP